MNVVDAKDKSPLYIYVNRAAGGVNWESNVQGTRIS
jgi:hypothetical protein